MLQRSARQPVAGAEWRPGMTMESRQPEESDSKTGLVRSTAPSSADLWHEILGRLNEVQEGQLRLARAIESLGMIVCDALAVNPQAALAGRQPTAIPRSAERVPRRRALSRNRKSSTSPRIHSIRPPPSARLMPFSERTSSLPRRLPKKPWQCRSSHHASTSRPLRPWRRRAVPSPASPSAADHGHGPAESLEVSPAKRPP